VKELKEVNTHTAPPTPHPRAHAPHSLVVFPQAAKQEGAAGHLAAHGGGASHVGAACRLRAGRLLCDTPGRQVLRPTGALLTQGAGQLMGKAKVESGDGHLRGRR
jgi:hypothetical protein